MSREDARQRSVPEDDDALAELLRMAASAPAISADRSARVRNAVRRAWEAQVAVRKERRRLRFFIAGPALAAAAALTIAVALWSPSPRPSPARPGAVARSLLNGAVVGAGEVLQTGPSNRDALQLTGGASLRLDRVTRVRFQSERVVELLAGAAYVDRGHRGPAIEIRTAFGAARDIGTQFEARVVSGRFRVRVRSGTVEMRTDRERAEAAAGNELTASLDGTISRSTVAVHGLEWDWTAAALPPFDIEGRSLDEFLRHVSREHGWTLRFSSADVERAALRTVLHGSIAGLTPDESLATVVPASGLRYRLRDGTLTLSGAPGPR